MQRLKSVQNLYRLYSKAIILALCWVLAACGSSVVKNNTRYTPKGEASSSVRDKFKDALQLMNDAEYTEAITMLEQINQQNNRLAGVHANLGIAYGKLAQYDEARAALETAVSLNSKSIDISNEMALAYRNTGDYDASRAIYQGILEKYPKNAQSHLNLGILCDIYINDIGCALKHYKEYEALYAIVSESTDKKSASLPQVDKNEKVVHWIADLEKRK